MVNKDGHRYSPRCAECKIMSASTDVMKLVSNRRQQYNEHLGAFYEKDPHQLIPADPT